MRKEENRRKGKRGEQLARGKYRIEEKRGEQKKREGERREGKGREENS